jgi:hypothetical protein
MKVSPKGGEICSAHVVAPLGDIKIQLTDGQGHDISGSLYGKVLTYPSAHSASFSVRFTSVAPEAALVLQRLVASCNQIATS